MDAWGRDVFAASCADSAVGEHSTLAAKIKRESTPTGNSPDTALPLPIVMPLSALSPISLTCSSSCFCQPFRLRSFPVAASKIAYSARSMLMVWDHFRENAKGDFMRLMTQFSGLNLGLMAVKYISQARCGRIGHNETPNADLQ